MNKPYQSSSKKFRDSYTRSNALVGYPSRDRRKQYISPKAQATPVSSIGSMRNNKPEFQQIVLSYPRKTNIRVQDRAIRLLEGDHLEMQGMLEHQPELAIRAREDASSPDVITSTFSLYNTNVIALIGPRSTHSYICMNLVSNKSLPIESTEFVIKVSNPLGKYVLVDKI
ncbi:Gag-Pol polyprotein [Gossypium australe]|uniref:Gag-Pol polyprotein n=1 Tax=Gossypium australe TaxID=47621 RepID=A0A5B6VWY4_9ROSI|nr:Gag-Pol polyprotein [Gossypium australe]